MSKAAFLGVRAILYAFSRLPFFILYLFSDLLYLILYYVVKYRRKVVSENLLNAFPEKTGAERGIIEKKFYRFLADMMVESTKMFTISEKEMRDRFTYTNLPEVTKYLAEEKSIIAVTGHYNNWEWASLSISSMIRQPVLVVYKPLTDKRFEGFLNKVRGRFGSLLIPMKQTLRKLITYKDTPHMLVLLGDQTPVRGETQYFTPFLNQPTAVFLGVEKIARSTNSPVVYFTIRRLRRGYYQAEGTVITENARETEPHKITIAHTKKLEQVIRENPEFWLWSHRRWKFKPEDVI